MKRIYLIIAALILIGEAAARMQVYETQIDNLQKDVESQKNLTDPLFSDVRTSFDIFTQSLRTIIDLKLNYDDPSLFTGHMKGEVDVQISYFKYDKVTRVWNLDFEEHTLEIDYNADGSVSIDRSAIVVDGGGSVTVRATAHDASDMTGATFPVNLEMNIRMEVVRYFPMLFRRMSSNDLRHHELENRGELEISWDHFEGAEYYDLEWAYVNDYGPDEKELDETEIHLFKGFFKNNSTRVSIEENDQDLSYRIPLLYEHGYVVYRVRPVGKTSADDFKHYVNGYWSESDNIGLHEYEHKFHFDGLHSKLNWHVLRDYIEDGKSKSLLTFMDGTMRSRQIITKINTEDEALVGETVYDSEGRAAISILPAPANDDNVRFYPMFNVAEEDNNQAYNWRFFDTDPEDDGCVITAGPLSNTSGAANYYSSANPAKNQDRHHSFLPESNGYPLAQTTYTRDNTSRVARQSIAGETFQSKTINPHDTRTFYAKPDQEELDIVFGADIGNAVRYRKVVEIDPNGQASITYFDADEQVVATALTGSVPINLEALPSFDKVNYKVNLLNGVANEKRESPDQASRGFTSYRVVAAPGDHTFDYSILPIDPLTVHCDELDARPVNASYCASCVLDMHIGLTDACGEPIINENVHLDPGECQPLNHDHGQLVVDLPQGEYRLAKYLTVNQEKLNHYANEYIDLMAETCFLTYEDILTSVYKTIDTLSCEYNCDDCLNELEQEFDLNRPPKYGDQRYQEYLDRVEQCEQMCGRSGLRCLLGYQGMLTDVSPHGQYGLLVENTPGQSGSENDDDEDGLLNDIGDLNLPGFDENFGQDIPDNSTFPLSVFNVNNKLDIIRDYGIIKLVLTDPHWRNPFDPYRDEDGSISEVRAAVVTEIAEDGTVNRRFEPKVLNHTPYMDQTEIFVRPEELAKLSDFVDHWRPSWAESLVYYHPEYSLYNHCLEMEEHFKFMEDFQRTTFEEAIISTDDRPAYIIPDNDLDEGHYRTNIDADPFFHDTELLGNLADFYRENMEHRIDEYIKYADDPDKYYSLWEWTYALDNCPLDNPEAITCSAADGNCHIGKGVHDSTSWLNYKAFYNEVRQSYEMAWQKKQSIAGGYYNGCIGNDDFSFVEDDLMGYVDVDFLGSFGTTPYNYHYTFNEHSLCNRFDWYLYSDKSPNFPLIKSMLDDAFSNEAFCVGEAYIENPYCPEKAEYVARFGRLKHQLQIYKDCGQCPVTWSLQHFLSSIVMNDSLGLEDEIRLGCSNLTEVPEFSTFLASAMGFTNNGANGENIYWRTDENTIQPEEEFYVIDALVTHDEIQSCQVYLKFKAEDKVSGLPIEDFDPAKLKHLCCLHYKDQLNLLTTTEYPEDPTATGQVFSFDARYGEDLDTSLSGEGFISCLRLDQCEFPMICEPTALSRDFFDLLSAIAREFRINDAPKENFFTNINEEGFDLSTPPYNAFVTPLLKDAGVTEEWKWIPYLHSEDGLNARLQSPTEELYYDVNLASLEEFPDGTDYSNIVSFSAFRSDLDSEDPSQLLLVNAKVAVNNNEYEMVTLQVRVASGGGLNTLRMVNCIDPITVDQ